MNDKREKPLGFTSREVVKRLLVACISLVMLLGITTSWFYYKEVNRERKNFKDEAEHNVNALKGTITIHFESVVSDILILSESKELKDFIDLNNEANRGALAKEFLLYSERKGLYDQIRFINEKGIEIVRVNFNDSKPYIVPEGELQDKEKRYYFQDTFGLHHGGIFVSPFDLNIEAGEIEQPLKPMIRLGMPVSDSHGEKRGIVVLNYLGTNLLEHFERVSSNTSLGEVMLLNADGFWMKSPRREEEWGFMYEDRTNLTFGNAFPGAWQQISSNGSGHFENADGLFVFTTFGMIYPLSEDMKSSAGSRRALEPSEAYTKSREFNWKIVSRITPAVLYENPKRLLHKLFLWNGVLLVILAVGSRRLSYSRLKRKQAEEALRRAHDELETRVQERTAELATINKALQTEITERELLQQQLVQSEKLAAVGELVSGVAHEINNPLTAVIGFAQLLKRETGDLNEDEQRQLDMIYSEAERVKKIVTNLLSFARKQKPEKKEVNINSVVEAVLGMRSYEIRVNNINVHTEFEEKLSHVEVDTQQIEQVFLNMMNNAEQAMAEAHGKGNLTIKTYRIDSVVRVEFIDDGPGIAKENLENVFDPFFTTKEAGKGTGLGLSVSYGIIKEHGGNILVESEEGKGTKFTIELPYTEEDHDGKGEDSHS